jgi:hypothetical protein
MRHDLCDIFMFSESLNNTFPLFIIMYFNLVKLSYNTFMCTCVYFCSHVCVASVLVLVTLNKKKKLFSNAFSFVLPPF